MTEEKTPHIPILCPEMLEKLDIQKSDTVLDVTTGFGGHSAACLEKLDANGQLIALDRDPEALNFVKKRFEYNKNIQFIHSTFSKSKEILEEKKLKKINILIADLGFSSYQLDQNNRGFSYLDLTPLDMRMDQKNQELTAQSILERYPEEKLCQLFQDYGDIRNPSKLVKNITRYRKKQSFKHNTDLKTCIKQSFFFRNNRKAYLRCCAQIFQALRIEVNQEMKELESLLNSLEDILQNEAKIAFLSFHSLEDKIIKYFCKANRDFKMLHKHVIRASQAEIRHNPRSKPAKLRVYEYKKNRNPNKYA
eukprot:COSAG01_NODE_216_length_21695_cov_83.368772_6_plen_307_part_00